MPAPVFYSVSMFGTGDIKVAANIIIASGVASLSVAQTGNIGVGTEIEYNDLHAHIAPNRIAFTSGGTVELKSGTKITGVTSSATGIVRFVELTGGTWAGENAAGWIYFEKTTGTWNSSEQINKTKPTSSIDIATTNGSLQGNIGGDNDKFVVKSVTGADAANQSSTGVTSIHHVWATLSAFEGAFTGASYINNADLTAADVVAFCCMYYDHDNYTVDSTRLVIDWTGTTDATRYLIIFTPNGSAESINNQRHSGTWDTNKAVLEWVPPGSIISAIDKLEDYIRIIGLQVGILNSGPQSYIRAIYTSVADVNNYTLIDSCIIRHSGTSSLTVYPIEIDNINDIVDIINTVVFAPDADQGNTLFLDTNDTVNIFHCTVYGSIANDVIERDTGDVTVTNTVSFHGLDDFDGVMTITFCASDDEDGADSQLLDSAGTPAYNTEFTNAAGGDFSLPIGSICIGNGTTLAASQGIWRDIVGNERGATPDIGAFEYVAVGNLSINVSESFRSSEALD